MKILKRAPVLIVLALAISAAIAVPIFYSLPLDAAEPLHVYLTYAGDPETTIDINVLMHKQDEIVMVHYDTEPRHGDLGAYRYTLAADYYQTLMELSDERTMHVASLTGLTPGTMYYFVAGNESDGYTKERKFRTLPSGDARIRFVNGGDMGTDAVVVELMQEAAKQDPDFAVIGGDIAYAEVLGEFKTWDVWLNNWEKHMVTSDGRTIPIAAIIGNHEVTEYISEDDQLQAPWYMGLFGRQSEQVYYSRTFGDRVVMYFLDSGHVTPVDGEQTAWLAQEMEHYKDMPYSFAVYHVPLYPSYRDFDRPESKLGRQHWLPLFDQYELTAGFEHHEHSFKRTKPLRNNEVAERGTIYVGDGCFGTDPRDTDTTPRWYNEVQRGVRHFWVVDVDSDGLKFKALDKDGDKVDSFTLQ